MSSDKKNKAFNKDGRGSGKGPAEARPHDSAPAKPGFAARAAATKILAAVIDRKTPLDAAQECGNDEFIQWLRSQGARRAVEEK